MKFQIVLLCFSKYAFLRKRKKNIWVCLLESFYSNIPVPHILYYIVLVLLLPHTYTHIIEDTRGREWNNRLSHCIVVNKSSDEVILLNIWNADIFIFLVYGNFFFPFYFVKGSPHCILFFPLSFFIHLIFLKIALAVAVRCSEPWTGNSQARTLTFSIFFFNLFQWIGYFLCSSPWE